MIYDEYNEIGKRSMHATRSAFIDMVGEDGLKDIIRNVFLGGNVRDTTEFITQKRLMRSFATTYELFIKHLADEIGDLPSLMDSIYDEMCTIPGKNRKTLYYWLLGLTKKGFDNIVRTQENLEDYKDSFSSSMLETASDIRENFGEVSGSLKLGEKEVPVTWELLMMLSICLSAQTLTLRGSEKSMNGKLFERLVLGTLLTIMDFQYCPAPPTEVDADRKLFWLSNMDPNERETDATLIYHGRAVSIDIGFIGKGNPEISLDKVTRFNRYKEIGGVDHTMKTIIIVDTIAENSDLPNKAAHVGGIVLQMIRPDWIVTFAKKICSIFGIDHPLQHKTAEELDAYLRPLMADLNIRTFVTHCTH